MSAIDRVAEGASRWLASRTTRRSLLATTGKVAVVAAGGATLASVFATRAEARACGQSGVSPRCPTYDCVGPDVVWGWCWYASPGCCTNGGLKKICDCCKRNHPNVHGYCPDGHNVYCMVESCLEDPRLQRVALERTVATDAVDVSLARIATRPSGGTSHVVIAAGEPLAAALAGPLATRLGLPVVLTEPNALRPGLASELIRLGVKRATVVAVGLSSGLVDSLRTFITELDLVGSPTDIAVASVDIALLQSEGRPSTGAVCIGADALSLDVAAAASSYASTRNVPVLIGVDAANAFRAQSSRGGATLLIGDPTVARAAEVVDAVTVAGNDPRALSLALADRLFTMTADAATASGTAPEKFGLAFVSSSLARIGAGYVPVGGPLIVHTDGAITPELRDWLQTRRARFAVAECLLGSAGALPDAGVIELQGALNGFDRQFLRGDDDGVGLPVYAQPLDERPIGMVRVTGPLPSTSVPGNVPRARHKRPIGVAVPETTPPRTAPGSPTTTTAAPPATTIAGAANGANSASGVASKKASAPSPKQ